MKLKGHTMKQNRIVIIIVALVVMFGGLILFFANRPTTTITSPTLTTIDPQNYIAQFSDAEHFLLDVRTPEEFAGGHIAGAVNISVAELPQRLSEVPQDMTVVVYCRSGNRSQTASEILSQAGYNSIYDLGGIIAWEAAGLPIEQ
jgi:phage shock protein E